MRCEGSGAVGKTSRDEVRAAEPMQESDVRRIVGEVLAEQKRLYVELTRLFRTSSPPSQVRLGSRRRITSNCGPTSFISASGARV